jgi:hypothetical protein
MWLFMNNRLIIVTKGVANPNKVCLPLTKNARKIDTSLSKVGLGDKSRYFNV